MNIVFDISSCDYEANKLSLLQVYVSCGEPWIDPHLTMAQHEKSLLLNNLASDISAIHAYCIMRNPEGKHLVILLHLGIIVSIYPHNIFGEIAAFV